MTFSHRHSSGKSALNRAFLLTLTLTLTWSLSAQETPASAAEAAPLDPRVEEIIKALQKQVKTLTEEVEQLKAGRSGGLGTFQEGSEDPNALLGNEFYKAKGLTIGLYGESKFRVPEKGNNTFDAHRYVFSPSYQINDWLVFNSELELEHGAVDESDNDGRDRFDGELELEQFYVDILLHENFNIRSLGIDLIPVGRINMYHEPTFFYSTERPELYREIIPSTWFEPSMSVFGKITDTLDYKVMVSTGLEDAIETSGSGGTSSRPPGYAAPGITGNNGMRNARPRTRRADENNLAYTGRLHYSPVEGLDASTSFYLTKVDGISGDSTVALFDVEALYRIPNIGLELRADFAFWDISDPQNLVANNNVSTTDDVGERMYGYYLEAAYHIWPDAWRKGKGLEMDLVPFVRFSSIHTQSHLGSGSSEITNGTRNRDFLTAGLAYFLNPNFVVKADWRHNLDGSSDSETSGSSQDYFQIASGVAF